MELDRAAPERTWVRSLILCGVTTNICVETTARDASQRDYRVFVVKDATGELTRERHENALAILQYAFGWVVTVDEVTAELAEAVKDASRV